MLPRRFIHFLFVVFCASSLGVSEAYALDVSPVADTFVAASNTTGNFGGAGAFAVSAPGLTKGELQSVLRFDLAAAKTSFDGLYGVGGWALSSAALKITAASPNNPIFNTSAAGQIAASWMQNDSWTEGAGNPASPGATGITFATLPSFLSGSDQSLGTFGFGGETSGTANYALTLSSGLKADAVAGGLASIRLFAADSAVSGVFNSRSNATPANRPALVLEAVAIPEPASCVLASFGILSTVAFARRCGRIRRCGG